MTFDIKNFLAVLASCALLALALSCNYGFNKYSPSTAAPTPTPEFPLTAGTFVISAASATIESPNTITLSEGTLMLTTATTADYGCTYSGSQSEFSGTLVENNAIDSNSRTFASAITTPSYMKINAVKMYMIKSGTPSGSISAAVYSTNGTVPQSLLASTGSYTIESLSSIVSKWVTFNLISTIEISGNTKIAISNVNAQSGWAGYDGTGNRYNWHGSSQLNDCTLFATGHTTTNGGTTWTSAGLRNYFLINVDTHLTAGTTSWVLEGIGGTWDMSTFNFNENSNGLTGGTIYYDIGTGESPVSPAYTDTLLLKSQVQSLPDKTGTYLYLRAHFSIGTLGFDNATISEGSISSY
jgi:hypothetical protein